MKGFVFATVLATATFASQANALSCLANDVATAFNRAAQADERYIVLLGSFDFPPLTAPDSRPRLPEDTTVQSTFTGRYLGPRAFLPAPQLDVTILFECMASWCGSLKPGEGDVLAFTEQTDVGYTLRVDPCFTTVLTEPDKDDIAQIEACMRGEPCEADQRNR